MNLSECVLCKDVVLPWPEFQGAEAGALLAAHVPLVFWAGGVGEETSFPPSLCIPMFLEPALSLHPEIIYLWGIVEGI